MQRRRRRARRTQIHSANATIHPTKTMTATAAAAASNTIPYSIPFRLLVLSRFITSFLFICKAGKLFRFRNTSIA